MTKGADPNDNGWTSLKLATPVTVLLPAHPDQPMMNRVAEVARAVYGDDTPDALEAIGFFMAAYSHIVMNMGLDSDQRFGRT